MTKYLLSTGQITTKIEQYILDLFRLYMGILPGDIPGLPNVGFNFILTNTKKDEIESEVYYRVKSLVDKISGQFSNSQLRIEIESIDLISYERAKVVLKVNQYTEDIELNLF